MKLIALRIDEEEKARLEQLAERGNVTLSRALREGAALYLGGLQAGVHQALGGRTTFHGLRRDRAGDPLSEASLPTEGERELIDSLKKTLREGGLGEIREAWSAGDNPRIVFGALGQWLSLVGDLYASNPTYVGWSWFVRDYCHGYAEQAPRDELHRVTRYGLVSEVDGDLGLILDSLESGFDRFLKDLEQQDRVRRAVLPAWQIMKRNLRED